jgi:hypothetical protein
VLPTLQSGKATGGVTQGTAGTTIQDLFVGGGVGSTAGNTDKSVLIFKGLGVSDTTGTLKIRNDKSTADSTKQNLMLVFDPSNIDLNAASNTNSKFLSEFGGPNQLDLADTTHYTNQLAVAGGGTGASTFTDGALLVGNGTSAVETIGTMAAGALVVGTAAGTNPGVLTSSGSNGQVLTVNTSASNGLEWATPVFKSTSFSATLDTNGNDIKLGNGVLRGSTAGDNGITLNTATDYVFIGGASKYYDSFLNVGGDITLGIQDGTAATNITARDCSSGTSPQLTIKASSSTAAAAGGAIRVQAGAGHTNGSGGNTTIAGGRKSGSGTEGSVFLETAGTTRLTIDESGHSTFADQVVLESSRGMLTSDSGAITQGTSLTTAVSINKFAGVITLHATAISAAAEHEFTVTNSLVSTTSMIMLTVQSAAASTENDGATLCANISDVAAGSFKIRLTNPGSQATSTSNKIHFLIIGVNS